MLMLLPTAVGLSGGSQVWLAADVTDTRGLNSLAAKVQALLQRDPFSGHMFVSDANAAIYLGCGVQQRSILFAHGAP
jgi:transposase